MKLQNALEGLKKKGIGEKKIAEEMGLSYAAVRRWGTGERCPKLPTIWQLESVYGVKIL